MSSNQLLHLEKLLAVLPFFPVNKALGLRGGSRLIKVLKRRFEELANQRQQVEATLTSKQSSYTGQYQEVDPELLLNWCVKAKP